MCFSQGMSAALAVFGFALAAYEHYALKCPRYTIGILYYACMELLQTIQYSFLAEPENDYAMCHDKTNQALTILAGLHICFQPLFTNMLFSSFFRTKNIRDRHESDMIQRLCWFTAVWFICSFFMANFSPDYQPSTEACPNYEYVKEGYDGFLKATTPNVPGLPCTFRPEKSTSGHLAWVLPLYQNTYFMPGSSIHFFVFFAPYIMSHRFCLQRMGWMMMVAGPLLAAKITDSVHEQPAIWCFISILKIGFMSVRARMCGYMTEPIPATLVHTGGIGEQRLEYEYVMASDPKKAPSKPKIM